MPLFNKNYEDKETKKYPDMYALFDDNREAKKFYDSLPDYVREHIATRPGGVNSFESLRHYSENLQRGDS